MNKTLIILAVIGLVVVGVIGGVVIEIYAPNSFQAFAGFIGTVSGFALTAIVTIAGLSIINNKVDTIKTQTNGINEALRNAAIQAINNGQLPAQHLSELPTTPVNNPPTPDPLEVQNGNGR